ncbi:ribonuclease Z [Algoriphagus ratkowskyi]|uniref:Ribonuclease Z n=1 Tax=Algoriphagus ratkowskyi TaxID=57028 RepID=A0A2W7QQ17_9BACT|nr:ribonuclease Z [Algoriphagus ratkowskyi]PZX50638.1 ribonuclease Z [Algoriphagus ratkowskyi]TXD79997.1 ribonuclease Z [Algoriphagus ratkowskyi]
MIPDFEVTILGNTSSIPVHGRHHTAQVVRFGQDFLLIDCGEAMQLQARAFKIKVSKINHIFISHLHGDHYLGLVGLLSSYNLGKRTTPLTLFGPQGLDEIITTNFRYSNTKLSYPLNFIQTHDDGLNLLMEDNRYKVYSFPLRHRLPTTGFLIREKYGLRSMIKEKLQQAPIPLEAIKKLRLGNNFTDKNGNHYKVADYTHPLPALRTYAYCSDTIFNPELKQYLKNVDLLYHESTFMEDNLERAAITFHSTAKQAAEVAKVSRVKKLLLGHFSSRYVQLEPLLEEAKSVFPNSILSEEGHTYAI